MRSAGADLRPDEILRLEEGRVVLLDQRRLPDEEVELVCRSAAEVADAIRTLAVRGAPAIGIAAAYGYVLAAAAGEDLDAASAALRAIVTAHGVRRAPYEESLKPAEAFAAVSRTASEVRVAR
jgi:methylthioribose-1-phosphate isomerase